MPNHRPLFPRKTTWIIILLIGFIIFLAYWSLKPKALPIDSPVPSPTPTPAFVSPSPFRPPIATPSAYIPLTSIPSPTPRLDPKTGWHWYDNFTHAFSFTYPPQWKTVPLTGANQPLVMTGSSDGQNLYGLTVSLTDQIAQDTTLQTATSSAFNYNGWQGKRYTTAQNGVQVAAFSVSRTSPTGIPLYLTWIESHPTQGTPGLDRYFKPILNSFTFSQPSPSPSPSP